MGIGYGLRALSGGLQTGMSMKMEKNRIDALKEEQKRQEKLAKQKETNTMTWYTTNENLLKTYHTQPQETRNMLLYESVQYSDDWHKTLRDFEDALQTGDLEEAKHINDMLEEKLKIEGEMLELGVTAENGFMGSMFTKEKMDYVKKLRMGALSNKPIGTAIYEGEYGKLPAEQPKALTLEDKTNIITKHLSNKNYPAAKHFSKMWGIPISEKGELGGGTTTPTSTPIPTSTENIREDILNADTFGDAKRIYDNYAKKYDVNALGITDLKQDWGKGQIDYLNNVLKSIENLLVDRGDKGKWLNNKPVTKETVGLEFDGEQPASEIYEILYKSYTEYLEKLRKLGIDVSQFPEILPLKEIEKVGGTEGFFGWSIQKGDYKSIYK